MRTVRIERKLNSAKQFTLCKHSDLLQPKKSMPILKHNNTKLGA